MEALGVHHRQRSGSWPFAMPGVRLAVGAAALHTGLVLLHGSIPTGQNKEKNSPANAGEAHKRKC